MSTKRPPLYRVDLLLDLHAFQAVELGLVTLELHLIMELERNEMQGHPLATTRILKKEDEEKEEKAKRQENNEERKVKGRKLQEEEGKQRQINEVT